MSVVKIFDDIRDVIEILERHWMNISILMVDACHISEKVKHLEQRFLTCDVRRTRLKISVPSKDPKQHHGWSSTRETTTLISPPRAICSISKV
jgi:hypothetical protein